MFSEAPAFKDGIHLPFGAVDIIDKSAHLQPAKQVNPHRPVTRMLRLKASMPPNEKQPFFADNLT